MESNLKTVKDEHCSNHIEMISGPWILKHFVCIQKKWLGKISCVSFGCQGNAAYRDGLHKGQKRCGPDGSRLRRGGENAEKSYTGKILTTQITTVV